MYEAPRGENCSKLLFLIYFCKTFFKIKLVKNDIHYFLRSYSIGFRICMFYAWSLSAIYLQWSALRQTL